MKAKITIANNEFDVVVREISHPFIRTHDEFTAKFKINMDYNADATLLMGICTSNEPIDVIIDFDHYGELFKGLMTTNEYEIITNGLSRTFTFTCKLIREHVCPDNMEMLDGNSYHDLKKSGFSDQQMVNQGVALWVFKKGDWVWTTGLGWSRLKDTICTSDLYILQTGEKSYTKNGYEYEDDKHPSLFKFDPIANTESPTNDDFDDMLNYYTNMLKELANDTIELDGIVGDTIDFQGIVKDLIDQGYVDLSGGQKADGSWYISGSKKS